MDILQLILFAIVGYLFLRYILPVLAQLWDGITGLFGLIFVGAIVLWLLGSCLG